MSGYTVITSDYLEHSRRDSIPNRFYFSHISNPTVTNGKIEFNVAFVYGVKKSNGTVGGRVIYTPNVYFIYDTGNRPSKEQLAKEIKPAITKMALNYSTPVSKEESDRAIDEAYKWVQRAPFSNTPISSKPFQTVKDEIRHSEDLDIIDVSETLRHSQHEGYYSPNNTANKATPYIFEKLVKSSAGNQIGARFKGQGDRQWVEIFVPTVDFTPNMQNFIALFNAEKGNVKIREEEMRKAARILTNFFNSPSLPGNEKMTTYVRKPKSLKHSLFTEVYDMDDYLEHHGILGMKWGVRRYQNADGSLTSAGAKRYGVKGDRKGAQNRLNDLDKAIARNKRHLSETEGEIKGYEKKVNKYANSHSSNADLKKDKYEAKADEARLKKAEYEKNIEAGKKEIESLLKEAVENGYTVQRIEAMRNTNEGKDALAAILASVAGIGIPTLIGAPIGMFFVPSNMEKGTKYKVKETKEGEEAKVVDKKGYYATTGVPRSINQAVEDGLKERERRQQSSTRGTHSYTPEQQREKLQTAKNNDRYDLDFLEFMQNTKISYDDNKTAMDKAYKEYLKDPEAFATDPDFYKKYPYA